MDERKTREQLRRWRDDFGGQHVSFVSSVSAEALRKAVEKFTELLDALAEEVWPARCSHGNVLQKWMFCCDYEPW